MKGNLLYYRRLATNYLCLALSIFAISFGLFWLFWILISVIKFGFAGINLDTFSKMTDAPGSPSGLLNAIAGSLLIVTFAIIIGTPIGFLTGTYLAEYGQDNFFEKALRFINDILLSAPSIVIGLFIYQIYVIKVQHFSGWAGSFALAIILIPIVARTTEDTFLLVPNTLREAAAALGAPRYRVTVSIVLRIARTGVLTGILLALARISGETAPLLFTALNNQFWSLNLNQPLANLPTVIFQYAMSPYEDWHKLAWTGALLITIWVLGINVIVRVLFKQKPPLH